MNATGSQLRDQTKIRHKMRPNLAPDIQGQVAAPLYVRILERLARKIRNGGFSQIEEWILFELASQM